MWARADESSEYLIGFYQRACAHSDETILGCDWDTPGFVPWWGEKGSGTTLGTIVIRVLSETLRHAGQLDIVRELVDGRIGAEARQQGDERWWREYAARVQAAADQFAR
ncbi:mycothiol transferase [Kribbella turkmenica]|uniref:mycothiol transferase n=1 Tax=Kribbella turkmenica TaxID=2530375 RepID=UPI002278DAE8|nr:DUF664 domain-containing protein [Kribbella turkmenica]